MLFKDNYANDIYRHKGFENKFSISPELNRLKVKIYRWDYLYV